MIGYKEVVHTVYDAIHDDEKLDLVIQTDRHGLTVELPTGQHIIIDFCGRQLSIHLSDTSGVTQKIEEINIKGSTTNQAVVEDE